LNKGKLVERRGRKATGLKPQGYDSRVAGSRCLWTITCLATRQSRFFVLIEYFWTAGHKALTDKGKPGESQRRKATDLRAEMSMIAGLPKKRFDVPAFSIGPSATKKE